MALNRRIIAPRDPVAAAAAAPALVAQAYTTQQSRTGGMFTRVLGPESFIPAPGRPTVRTNAETGTATLTDNRHAIADAVRAVDTARTSGGGKVTINPAPVTVYQIGQTPSGGIVATPTITPNANPLASLNTAVNAAWNALAPIPFATTASAANTAIVQSPAERAFVAWLGLPAGTTIAPATWASLAALMREGRLF